MMDTYEEYFSDDAIIHCLCRIRLGRANAIHQRRFYRKVFDFDPESDFSELNKLFPPRKIWHRFRPRKQHRKKTTQHNLQALRRCINWHLENAPKTPWTKLLSDFVGQLKKDILIEENFIFKTPKIIPQPKKGRNEFRAIASFPDIREKVVDIINAKYLRENLECCLEDACRAFRSGDKRHLDRNSAIDDIYRIRENNPNKSLFVTECDIRGFFDCVHHPVAKSALKRAIALLAIRAPDSKIDRRAVLYFSRYLDAYSFSKTTLSQESWLKKKMRNPDAVFKWPTSSKGPPTSPDTLNHFHSHPKRCKIGVPQGGAHSCLIANLILDLADKEVCLALSGGTGDSLYLRYCDDIIIIATEKEVCRGATNAYYRALKAVKLPYHLPTVLDGTMPQFFEDSKTKECYRWGSKDPTVQQFPWIQFLGYQIRHDGEIRVRPSSIKKQKDKIENLSKSLRTELKIRKSKISKKRVLYRFESKLWAFSSGRVQLHIKNKGPLPMCWASGFKQLATRKFSARHIRNLDDCAGRERRRLERFLRKSQMGSASKKANPRNLGYFGKPFSHLKQFDSGK